MELLGPPGMGATRLGCRMLVEPSRSAPVAVVDVRGWFSPLAAWEVGIDPDRLVVVRCPEPRMWAQLVGLLLEGMGAVMAEVPMRFREREAIRLAALARSRRARVVFRSSGTPLPSGVPYLRLRVVGSGWEGVGRGRGLLARRRLTVEISGRGVGGMSRTVEVEDVEANPVRLVSRLAVGR